MRGVRVVGILVGPGLKNAGETLAVGLREAIGRPLSGRRLEVVEVPRFLLELHHFFANVVENPHAHIPAFIGHKVLGVTRKVSHHLVHAVYAERREVVAEVAHVALCVRVETAVDELLHGRAAPLKRVLAKLERFLIALVEVAEASHVDRDHADRSRELGASEQSVAAFEELAKVDLKTAAHRANLARVELRVNEVLEVWEAVLCGHREQAFSVRGIPLKIARDVVGRDREGKNAAIGVTFGHDVDVRAVDEIHFLLQFAVGEVAYFPTDEGVLVREIGRTIPVEREVREGALASPAARHVEVVDHLLHVLAHLLVTHRIEPHERRHVGIE